MVKSLIAVVIVAVSTLSASGQQQPGPIHSAQLGEDLAGIRVALERLVELREAEFGYARVDSILNQMNVWLQRMAPIERKLTIAEDQLRSAENNLRQLRLMKEQQEAERDLDIESGLDSPRSEARRMLADIARSRLASEEKIEAARLRIQEYENERTHLLRRIDTLEAALLDLLDAGG